MLLSFVCGTIQYQWVLFLLHFNIVYCVEPCWEFLWADPCTSMYDWQIIWNLLKIVHYICTSIWLTEQNNTSERCSIHFGTTEWPPGTISSIYIFVHNCGSYISLYMYITFWEATVVPSCTSDGPPLHHDVWWIYLCTTDKLHFILLCSTGWLPWYVLVLMIGLPGTFRYNRVASLVLLSGFPGPSLYYFVSFLVHLCTLSDLPGTSWYYWVAPW